MQIEVLQSKIHRAKVTQCDINYEGSISIDKELLEQSGILPFQKVDIYNINNGARFSTYAIEADAGSKIIGLNGAAARLTQAGDLIIICAFTQMSYEQAKNHKPIIVLQ